MEKKQKQTWKGRAKRQTDQEEREPGQRLDGLPSFRPRPRPLPSPPSCGNGRAEQKSKKKGRKRENQCEGCRRPLRPFLASPSAPSDVYTVHTIASSSPPHPIATSPRVREGRPPRPLLGDVIATTSPPHRRRSTSSRAAHRRSAIMPASSSSSSLLQVVRVGQSKRANKKKRENQGEGCRRNLRQFLASLLFRLLPPPSTPSPAAHKLAPVAPATGREE